MRNYNINKDLKKELNNVYNLLIKNDTHEAIKILKDILNKTPPKILRRKILACKHILKSLSLQTGKTYMPYVEHGKQIFYDDHRLVILSEPLSYFKVNQSLNDLCIDYDKFVSQFYEGKKYKINDIIPSIQNLRKDIHSYKLNNKMKYYLRNGMIVNESSLLSMLEIITDARIYWDDNTSHALYFINDDGDFGVLLPIVRD